MDDYDIFLEIEKLTKELSPDKGLVLRLLIGLLSRLELLDRIELAFLIYTADFTEKPDEKTDEESVPPSLIRDPGSQALRFWELEVQDIFVCVPTPRDKLGNAGLKHRMNVYKKLKACKRHDLLEIEEMNNAVRITDGRIFNIHPASWVLKLDIPDIKIPDEKNTPKFRS